MFVFIHHLLQVFLLVNDKKTSKSRSHSSEDDLYPDTEVSGNEDDRHCGHSVLEPSPSFLQGFYQVIVFLEKINVKSEILEMDWKWSQEKTGNSPDVLFFLTEVFQNN